MVTKTGRRQRRLPSRQLGLPRDLRSGNNRQRADDLPNVSQTSHASRVVHVDQGDERQFTELSVIGWGSAFGHG